MIDWQPHLIGTLVELRPIRPADFDALFAVASDPEIWAQHPARDRCQEPVFRAFFHDALASQGAFMVYDRATGSCIGSSRFHGHDAARSQVEIGWTFLARSHWGGRFNGEMKRLMLDYAFRHVERVVFLVGEGNVRSRTALERIGARGTAEREVRLMKGVPIPHLIYEIRRPALSGALPQTVLA